MRTSFLFDGEKTDWESLFVQPMELGSQSGAKVHGVSDERSFSLLHYSRRSAKAA